jgi:hypothetical protein
MMEKLALIKGTYYEGDSQDLRIIHPTPVVSAISCPFISLIGGQQSVFREDSFDPVTRIRRGRLYIDNRNLSTWYPGRIDHGSYNPYPARISKTPLTPDVAYDAWQPDGLVIDQVIGRHVEIGHREYSTKWRIVGAEWISVGHVLFTLRAHSLFGVIPKLNPTIIDATGTQVDGSRVAVTLEALVDAAHRQQATATVDVARETAKVILTTWIGPAAYGKDLADVIKAVPKGKNVIVWAASVVNRFHSRGKSAAVEKFASMGSALRAVTEDDADACVSLIGLLLREIEWAAP